MRLIDADELIEIAHRIRLDSRERIERMIENAPTVDPIKHGHWIEVQRIHEKDHTARAVGHCFQWEEMPAEADQDPDQMSLF